MDHKCTDDTRFQYNKDMDENLEWLTQNTKDPTSKKGTLFSPLPRPHTHTHTHTQ